MKFGYMSRLAVLALISFGGAFQDLSAQEIRLDSVIVAFGEGRAAVDDRLTKAGLVIPRTKDKKPSDVYWLAKEAMFLRFDSKDRLYLVQAYTGFKGELAGVRLDDEPTSLTARFGTPRKVLGKFARMEDVYETEHLLIHVSVKQETGKSWLISVASRTFVPHVAAKGNAREAAVVVGGILLDAICLFGPDTRLSGTVRRERNEACIGR